MFILLTKLMLFIIGSFWTYNVNVLIPTAKLRLFRQSYPEKCISGMPNKRAEIQWYANTSFDRERGEHFTYRDSFLQFSIFNPCVMKELARSLLKEKRRLPCVRDSLSLSFRWHYLRDCLSRIAYLIRVCVWSWCVIYFRSQWIQRRYVVLYFLFDSPSYLQSKQLRNSDRNIKEKNNKLIKMSYSK